MHVCLSPAIRLKYSVRAKRGRVDVIATWMSGSDGFPAPLGLLTMHLRRILVPGNSSEWTL